MPSSKGKPTDPKLRQEVVEDVKNETNKDGSGKGQMAAWKGAKIAKEYEAKGGDYEDVEDSTNKPKKGTPEPKDDKDEEIDDKPENGDDAEVEDEDDEPEEKPKANTGKKAGKVVAEKKAPKAKKEKVHKEPTRVSSRQAALPKRKTPEEDDDEDDEPPAKVAKPAAKKAKITAPESNGGDKKPAGRGRPKKDKFAEGAAPKTEKALKTSKTDKAEKPAAAKADKAGKSAAAKADKAEKPAASKGRGRPKKS